MFTVKRIINDIYGCIGVMLKDDQFLCFTLEDPIRKAKIPKNTGIPQGLYDGRVTMSPSKGERLPEIFKVPNYAGIRIHPGNGTSDTEGCLLVGDNFKKTANGWFLYNSRNTFGNIFPLFDKEPFRIKIDNVFSGGLL